ncbi:predicted protein [Lichtheimia corymbifera JMRC:FSU:9682]|uniref:Uncharacterized protein n=1 Tax=Lichtheimia corymbifera JMRC:FSU:9682 TaxID=1263082 RepID=A0A068S556_9FUNG|nr:predicted protein [Lichtheimia corymbifera JMRC:FSU:9682]
MLFSTSITSINTNAGRSSSTISSCSSPATDMLGIQYIEQREMNAMERLEGGYMIPANAPLRHKDITTALELGS